MNEYIELRKSYFTETGWKCLLCQLDIDGDIEVIKVNQYGSNLRAYDKDENIL